MGFCDYLINFSMKNSQYGANRMLNVFVEQQFVRNPNFVYPYYINLILTRDCNTKCYFCSADSTRIGSCHYTDNDCIRDALKQFLQERSPLIFALCGGEPMLYPLECIKYIKLFDINTAIYLLTNLNYPFTEAHIAVFQEMTKHKYSMLQTSIDTLNQSTLKFLRPGSNLKLIKQNIRKIKEFFPEIELKINVTVSEFNFQEIAEVLQFCSDEKIDCVHCNYVLPIGRAKRKVTLSSFFKVLQGLTTVADFAAKENPFKELTISIPAEVMMIQALFSSKIKREICADIRNDTISSKQYICNINLQDCTCYAGWEGSKRNPIGKTNLLSAFEDAANSPQELTFKKCNKCAFASCCNSNTTFFQNCFLEEFKDKIDTLVHFGNRYSEKELARNRIYDIYQDFPNPVCMDLIVTDMCNGHCFFCQSNGGHKDRKQYFELNDFEKFIGNQSIHLSITGGEPLCRGSFVENLIKVVKKTSGSTICLLTNLSLLNDEQIELMKLYFGYFDVVQVSIYAADPENHKKICGRDDWEVINQNIKKLVAANISVRANLTLNEYNVFDIEKIYNFYMKLGIDHICISCLLNKGFAENMVTENYILNYVFETAKFAKLGYQNYNIAVPVEALRCYHNCMDLLHENVNQYSEDNTVSQNLKLYIDYDGEIFYSEAMEPIGNIKLTSLSEIPVKNIFISDSLCSNCNAHSICGGRLKFNKNGATSYCSFDE